MTSTTNAEQSDLFSQVQAVIVALRRKQDVEENWRRFEQLIEINITDICATFDSRWLTSICDTYVDFADPLTRRNALLIGIVVKMEKMAQSYMHWRLGYPERLGTPIETPHRKIDLWDGVRSFHLEIGDAPNSMFGRIFTQLAETPLLRAIFDTIIERLKQGDTVLGNLNRQHHHVFEPDFSWILEEAYRPLRESGRIPRHRYEHFLRDDMRE